MGNDFYEVMELDEESKAPKILSLLEKADNKEIETYLEEKGLHFPNAGGKDRFASFLFNLRRWQILFVVLAGLMISSLPALVSWLEGTFYDTQMDLCFAKDIGYYNLILTLTALLLMCSMYFSELPRTLIRLNISKVFNLDAKAWNKFVDRSNEKFEKPYLTLLPYLICIPLALFVMSTFMLTEKNRWHRISFEDFGYWAGWLSIPTVIAYVVLIGLLIIRIVTVYFVLKDFFGSKPIIQPLHPDNCGGLYPLGRLSMKLNYGVFLFGIISCIGIYGNMTNFEHLTSVWHPCNLLIIVVYVLGAFIIFFLPLYSAHNAMKNSKDQMIQQISDRYIEINNHIISLVKQKKQLDKPETEELELLKKMYDVVSKMPVYPFNIGTVSSFICSVFAPIVMFIIQNLISAYFFN